MAWLGSSNLLATWLRRKADRILNMPEDGKNTMLYTTTIPPEKLVKNQVAT